MNILFDVENWTLNLRKKSNLKLWWHLSFATKQLHNINSVMLSISFSNLKWLTYYEIDQICVHKPYKWNRWNFCDLLKSRKLEIVRQISKDSTAKRVILNTNDKHFSRFLRKRALFFCIEIDPFIDLDRSEINIYCYHTNARGIFQNDVLILVRCFCWLIFFCHIIRVPPKKGLSIFVFVFGYSGAKETFCIVCVLLQKSLIHTESIVWPMYTIQIKAKTKYK